MAVAKANAVDAERRGGLAFAFALALALLAALAGVALGVWQLQRLAWKTGLIARIEARVNAEAAPSPGLAEWPALEPGDYEYRRVTLSGHFMPEAEAKALALTEIGTGFWVMTPFMTGDGSVVYVNRGFVPQEAASGYAPEAGPVTLTGLMRAPEPGGLFLRPNDAARGRWYSRDIAAMAAASGLSPVAPFFIDRAAGSDPSALPIGGLTRISFPNNHLLYAVQFFLLALVAAGGAIYLIRLRRRKTGEG